MVAQANGVGKKLAERIVTELKDKAASESWATPVTGTAGITAAAAAVPAAGADAVSALLNLGFRPLEAQQAVQAALAKAGADLPVAELIRASLKEATGKAAR
jgi:Holliday junction DNA helicase RuvA